MEVVVLAGARRPVLGLRRTPTKTEGTSGEGLLLGAEDDGCGRRCSRSSSPRALGRWGLGEEEAREHRFHPGTRQGELGGLDFSWVLVPIGVSVAFLGERPSWLQGAGIALAVAAAVAMNGLPKGEEARARGRLFLPLLLTLLFNGCSDSMSKIFAYAGRREEDGLFVFFIFFFAGLFTLVLLLRQRKGLALRDVLLGALVGVPNFCASRLLLAALTRLPAFVVYPCYSVGAILVISLCSVLLFHERLSRRQWGAVGMILAAVALLNL